MKCLLFALPCLLAASQELYLGPDVFFREYKEAAGQNEERGWLYGFQGGYELIENDIPYFGTDLRYAEGSTDYNGAIQNKWTGAFTPFHSFTKNTLFNIEGRVGYPFCPGKWSLIPFLGMGFQNWFREAGERANGYDELYRWAYFAQGARLYYGFNRFSIGVHLKMMEMKMAKIEIRDYFPWPAVLTLGNKLQMEIELPFSYSFKKWQIDLTPYFRWLPIGQSRTQSTPQGPFFEPASNTIVSGARLEAAIEF